MFTIAYFVGFQKKIYSKHLFPEKLYFSETQIWYFVWQKIFVTPLLDRFGLGKFDYRKSLRNTSEGIYSTYRLTPSPPPPTTRISFGCFSNRMITAYY